MIAFSQRAFLLNEETGATKMGPWRPLTPLSLIVEDKSNICKLQNAISKELGMEGFFANWSSFQTLHPVPLNRQENVFRWSFLADNLSKCLISDCTKTHSPYPPSKDQKTHSHYVPNRLCISKNVRNTEDSIGSLRIEPGGLWVGFGLGEVIFLRTSPNVVFPGHVTLGMAFGHWKFFLRREKDQSWRATRRGSSTLTVKQAGGFCFSGLFHRSV